MRSLVMAFAALSLAACSAEATEVAQGPAAPERAPEAARAPGSTEAPARAAAPPSAGPTACDSTTVVSYPVGKRCGLEAAGTIACPGSPKVEGFVYACEDEGGEPRRPNVSGCVNYVRYEIGGRGFTLTLCPSAACQRYDDARCGGDAGFACPDSSLPGVPSLSTDALGGARSCSSPGGWANDLAHGPLLCCH